MDKELCQGNKIRTITMIDGSKSNNKNKGMVMIVKLLQEQIASLCLQEQEQRLQIKSNKIGKKSLMNLLEIFHKKKLIFF